MKKIVGNGFRKRIIGFTILSSFLLPIAMVSCSQNSNSNLTEQDIENQFIQFNNSLVNEKIKDNLYFENFNFINDVATLNSNEIGNIISLRKLSDAYDYVFIVSKISDSSILIEMKVKIKNSNRDFISNSKYNKIISNVKSLNEGERTGLDNIYQSWVNGANSISIKNTSTNNTLNQDKYSTILPSYLKMSNIEIDYSKVINNTNLNLDSKNVNVDFEFDDIKGEIRLILNIINDKTLLPFYSNNYLDNHIMVIKNFINLSKRNTQITEIFSALSKTFNVNSIVGQDKQIPVLASGVNNISKIKDLFSKLSSVSNQENTNLNNINTVIDASVNNTYWFSLSPTSTANDINGNLVITWTLIDNFSGYIISPQNINKITTVNEMLRLKKTIKNENDGEETDDLTSVDNGYKAYNELKKLELTSKYSSKASEVKNTDITNDWLLSNTNIQTLFNGIKKSSDGNYLEFSLTKDNKTNDFRFKIDNSQITNLNANNIDGTINIPFMMQIKVEDNFVMNKGEEAKQSSEYIDFLPPNGKSGSGTSESYNSAVRSSSIIVGGYLTNDIEAASLVYDNLSNSTNKSIEIIINNENYFEDILKQCLYDESQLTVLFEEEIKNIIKDSISNNTQTSNHTENVTQLLEKYSLSFDLKQNVPIQYDETNKIISSKEVTVKLISKGENVEQITIPYYNSGKETTFPTVKIIVKYTA
ncbi:MAG: hypothetical protein HDR43_03005 [Mycoplasma sp.]|nr:hypothetical protein [Mycoplasma sp.]